ncbi:hypothetical protein ACWGQ5_56730 [Streptomyces sp. NPDC055722]
MSALKKRFRSWVVEISEPAVHAADMFSSVTSVSGEPGPFMRM